MDIARHISASIKTNPSLFEYMDSNNVPYEDIHGIGVFDILESSPHWRNISKMIDPDNPLCICNTIYTQEELDNAQWLMMRSVWYYGYPQPEGGEGFERITYSAENFCKACCSGLIQKDAFRIKKVPKWGKRHFVMLNWVSDEIFANDTVKELLSNSGMTGFCFRDVYDKKGTVPLDGISQIYIQNYLPYGLLADAGAIKRVTHCTECGITKYLCSGRDSLKFKKEIFTNAPDIVKTSEKFGGEYHSGSKIIVSQRFYQFVMKNRLGSALEFKPIELH